MPKRSKLAKKRDLPDSTAPNVETAAPARPECFLSHAHQDEAFAYRIETLLADHGVEAWFAHRKIVGAQDWHDQIGDALTRCNWFIVILSPDAAKSIWVSRELKYALNQPRLQGRIIPVLHRTCDHAKLSWTLDSIQIIDFRRRFHEGCKELLEIWHIPYAP